MADDVDEKFDASEPSIPSVSDANAELRRIATVRAEAAFTKGAQQLEALRADFERLRKEHMQRAQRLDVELARVIVELGNWIGLLKELEERHTK